MQSTGIVPSRPTTAWEVSRSSWIAGMQRPDADELRPQRERGEEERGEERASPQGPDDGVRDRAETVDLDRDLVAG